jgi:pimeloyl-ACP methyl ester carboxylesterase
VARTLGATAAVAGGLALGFIAERRLLHPRLEPPAPEPGSPVLGTIAGELSTVEGPDGLPITVETYGPPEQPSDAPQLVLAHGWICTGRAWHEQVRGLADRYRLVTYDHPGHGRTPAPASGEYDLDLLGDSLRAVVEQATGPGPIVLVGHSLGGIAALNAVDRHRELFDERVAGVVLMSTTSRARLERFTFEFGIHAVSQLERGIRRVVPTLRGPRLSGATGRLYGTTSDLSTLLVRAMGVGPGADPRVVEFVEQLRVASDPDMVLGLAEAVLGVDVDAGLARLRADVSIVVGTHDRLTPLSLSERMAEVSGGELIELPGIGHMAPLEAGAQVNEVLERHLRQASTTAARPDGETGRREDRQPGDGRREAV